MIILQTPIEGAMSKKVFLFELVRNASTVAKVCGSNLRLKICALIKKIQVTVQRHI